MKVVGHNYPSTQVIPLRMMETQGVFDQPPDVRPLQTTFAPALIQILFESQPAFTVVLDLEHRFPFRTQCCREAIGKMKGHELREAGFVAVRQVATFMPTAKTAYRVFPAHRHRPLPLDGNKLAHTGIVW